MIDVFHDFSQVLQVNVGIIPRLHQDRFLPDPFQLIIIPTIRRYVIIRNEIIVPTEMKEAIVLPGVR
jgi:hypothetical protein